MNFDEKKLVIGLVVFCMVVFSAFIIVQASEPDLSDPRYGGEMVVLDVSEDYTLCSMCDPLGGWWFGLLSDPPFMVPPRSGELDDWSRPGWLEKFTISPDERVLTFYIKEGVTFHDGTPLDAKGFAWILRKRIVDPNIWATPLRGITDPQENIQVVDKYTLKVIQDQNNPNLRYVMSTWSWLGGMDTPHWDEKYGEDYGQKEVYSLGPFKMEEWVKGDYTTFVRNEDYTWAPSFSTNPGPPYLERVTIEYVPEAATRLAKLKTGEADMDLSVPPAYVEDVKKLEDYEVLTSPSNRLYLTSYNTTQPPLDDIDVRKALNYAIDKALLAKEIFHGYAQPAYSLYMAESLEQPTTKHLYEYDVEKANSLLEEAGWRMENDGFRYKDGKRLEFKFSTRSTGSLVRKLAVAVQAMWREVGVKANVELLKSAAFRSMSEAGEHQATIRFHAWPTLDMPYWMFDPANKGYAMQSMYDTEELRNLIEENKAATTNEEWVNTTDDLVNFVNEKALRGALVRPLEIMAVKDVFMNVFPTRADTHEASTVGPDLRSVYRKDVYEKNLEK